jgi:hypothetical protein
MEDAVHPAKIYGILHLKGCPDGEGVFEAWLDRLTCPMCGAIPRMYMLCTFEAPQAVT